MAAEPAKVAEPKPTGLALLRQPFPAHQVSKLPKQSKQQTEQVKNDRSVGVNCRICGGWHHKSAVHLDYVGHAALTDRLLDADPSWLWEPASLDEAGLPCFDRTGGLWIKLTVCGVTRLGYGHAAPKANQDPGAREKEVIGDALRNAAMRFGAALDLWHKGDLHADEEGEAAAPDAKALPAPKHEPEVEGDRPPTLSQRADLFLAHARDCATIKQLAAVADSREAARLKADLERSDPERGVEVEAEIVGLFNKLERAAKGAPRDAEAVFA